MEWERTIPDPGFAGDDGSADERLRGALSVYLQDPDGGYLPVLAALSRSRVLVPVVAVLGDVEYDEQGLAHDKLAHDKTSDMAAVLFERPDGARALLAFTSSETLSSWNPEGRPVPVTAQDAARSAKQEQARALLLDLAGPVRFAVEGDDLDALAAGWQLVSLADGRWGWLTTEETSPGD